MVKNESLFKQLVYIPLQIPFCLSTLLIIHLASNLKGAASMAGRKVTVLRQAGAACDHPIDPSYPEGQYLSNYLLRVM